MSAPLVELPQSNPENTTITEPSVDPLYYQRKELFQEAMNREWEKVLGLYRDKKVQSLNITHDNDTLLHVAISDATEKTVLDLLNIVEKEMYTILSLKNKAGDTALHLAAGLGLDEVCRRMVKMNPKLVTDERNNLQETPLFSAVRHGKKKAFFALEVAIHEEQKLTIDEDCLSKRDIKHCRRLDGNNILHYAIRGEQFDLAYEIIRLYPKLVNFFNSSGETALHTLANMPSVFKSGARFGTITEPLKRPEFDAFLEKEKKNEKIRQKKEKENESEEQSDIQENEKKLLPPTCKVCIDLPEKKLLPPTYKVCIDLFSLMKVSTSCISNTVASSAKTGICKTCSSDEENPAGALKEDESKSSKNQKQRRWFPPNYEVTISFFKIIVKLLLVVLGIGLWRLETIRKLKQKHRNAKTIMKELVDRSTLWEYEEASGGLKPAESQLSSDIGSKSPPLIPSVETTDHRGSDEKTLNSSEDETVLSKVIKELGIEMLNKVLEKGSLKIVGEKESTNILDTGASASPVLVAAKSGITEIVKRILKKFPVAVKDKDKDEKNIVLLAVEHRQVHVYKYMLRFQNKERVFGKVDKDDNSALHLAATLSHSRPWSIPGAALQMQWESKWYKYVQNSIDLEIFSTVNKEGKMPEKVFIDSHDKLVEDGSNWLTHTSESCSVVAALVATVAFASASTVPGGVEQSSGFPVFSGRPVFQLFAISSLVALCFSITSLVMFLAILTSRYEVRDFNRGLPVKLILGLTSLFMGITSMLVAFCAGDFFVVEKKLKFAVYPIYAVMCFPVTFFAFAQFPLYIDLIKATIKKVPERTEKIDVY